MTYKGMTCGFAVALLVLGATVPARGQEEGAETSLEAFRVLLNVVATGGTIFLEMGRDAAEEFLIHQGLHPTQPSYPIWERRDERGIVTYTSGLISGLNIPPFENYQRLHFYPSEPGQIPDQFLTHLLQTSKSTEYDADSVTITLAADNKLILPECSITRSYSFRLNGGALYHMGASSSCLARD